MNKALGRDTPPRWSRIFRGALQAGAFAYLCVLCGGTVLLVAAKLQVTDLGAGASMLSVFKAVVIVGLGALGATVRIGGLEVTVLPLGAIALVGLGVAWGTRRAMGEAAGSWALALRARAALLVGACLALLCAGSALWFRLGEGSGEIAATAVPAGVAGWFWGSMWSLLGLSTVGLRATLAYARSTGSLSLRGSFGEGLRLSLWLILAALLGVSAFGVARVVFRTGSSLGAVGSIVHGVAFAPNLAAAAAALALGGSVEAGFGALASGADEAAPEYSVLDWVGGPAPAVAWLLPLVALVCVIAMGRRLARTRGAASSSTPPRSLPVVTMICVGLAFATTLALLALAGDARAGIVESEGFARLAPNPLQVFVLGLGWSAVGLPLGWVIGRKGRGTTRHDQDENEVSGAARDLPS